MTDRDPMIIGDQHAGDRLLASQKLQPGSVYLLGEEPPTPTQISAVLHALADHGLQAHMNSEVVLALGEDRADLGGTWRADSAHGRFLQRLGDYVAMDAPEQLGDCEVCIEDGLRTPAREIAQGPEGPYASCGGHP